LSLPFLSLVILLSLSCKSHLLLWSS
jgi:hypothetical protein